MKTFWAILKWSIFKFKLPWLLFGQRLEELGLLFLSASGHTAVVIPRSTSWRGSPWWCRSGRIWAGNLKNKKLRDIQLAQSWKVKLDDLKLTSYGKHICCPWELYVTIGTYIMDLSFRYTLRNFCGQYCR